MNWMLIVAAAVSLALAVTASCISWLLSRRKPRRSRYEREEIQIDPAKVPEFKPTWRDTR